MGILAQCVPAFGSMCARIASGTTIFRHGPSGRNGKRFKSTGVKAEPGTTSSRHLVYIGTTTKEVMNVRFSFATTIISGWNYPHPIFSYVPTTEERQPILTWARKAGYDGIDIADTWMNWFGMSEADLYEFRDQVRDAGLTITGLNPYRCIPVRHESAARNEEKLAQSIEVCRALDCRMINLALSVPFPAVWSEHERAERQLKLARDRDYTDDDFAEAAAKIARLADVAARDDIHLSIELHDDGMTDTSAGVLRLHRLVNRPNVGVNPDLQNGYRVPYPTEDWRAALLALAPHTNYWHVKSCAKTYHLDERRTYSHRASIRDGDIDHRWALTQLVRAGYDGWIVVESGGGDSLVTNASDRDYLADLVETWLPIALGQRATSGE
jgi:sugar phosphate isomerase/epimerase